MENALFIQEREEGYAHTPLAAILKEFCSHTDGATMSGKKDPLVNIGGWLSTNDEHVFEEALFSSSCTKGHTYGMAGRDMEAMAIGIREALDDDYMKSRVGQVRYIGMLLEEWGVPFVKPVGGHGIFLDARAFYPTSTRSNSRRRWPRSCTRVRASGPWSAASCPPDATP